MFVVLLHFYSPRPTPAYAEIASALRARSHKVWIGQPSLDGSFVFLDTDGEAARIPGGFGRIRALPFMLRLRRYLSRLQPDIVQITPHPWSWLLAVAPRSRAVFLNDIRTAGSGVGRGLRAWLVDASAWASWRLGAALWYDATLFLNETGARWLFGRRWKERGRIVPLGVGGAFLETAASGAGAPADPVRFVYLGTISLHRNLEQVLMAARAVHDGVKPFRLKMIGPDDGIGGIAAVRALIQREGLESIVDVAPAVDYADVPQVLAGFDVALNYLPAARVLERQISMKTLECRALGLPQITTRTAASADVVVDGDNALLVEDTVEAYAAAMQRILDEPDLLPRLKRRAVEMRAGVTWVDVADRYASVYHALRDARR